MLAEAVLFWMFDWGVPQCPRLLLNYLPQLFDLIPHHGLEIVDERVALVDLAHFPLDIHGEPAVLRGSCIPLVMVDGTERGSSWR